MGLMVSYSQPVQIDLFLALLAGVVWICLAQTLFNRDKVLRARVTANVLWKIQFFFHPFIIGAFVLRRWKLPIIFLTPFVFNFGVEPWDLPRELLFYTCFYAHHFA